MFCAQSTSTVTSGRKGWGAFSGRVDCHKPEGRNGNQRDLFAAGINDVHERRGAAIPHSLTRGRKTGAGQAKFAAWR